MEQCNLRQEVILLIASIPLQKFLNLLGNQYGFRRLSLSARDVNGNTSIHPSVLDISSQDQKMNLLDDPFGKRLFILHELRNEVESLFVADDIKMVFQGLLVDGQSTEDEIRFLKGQSVAFDGIGIVGVFDGELFVQRFDFVWCKRVERVKFMFQFGYGRKNSFCGFSAVGRLFGVARNLPCFAL